MRCVLCRIGAFTRLTESVKTQPNFIKLSSFSCNTTLRFYGFILTLCTTTALEQGNKMRYLFDALLQATFTIVMGGCVLFVALYLILML